MFGNVFFVFLCDVFCFGIFCLGFLASVGLVCPESVNTIVTESFYCLPHSWRKLPVLLDYKNDSQIVLRSVAKISLYPVGTHPSCTIPLVLGVWFWVLVWFAFGFVFSVEHFLKSVFFRLLSVLSHFLLA